MGMGTIIVMKDAKKDGMILIFSSVEFLLFFLPIFILCYALSPAGLKNITLLAGSLIFYACGDPDRLGLLVLSVVINYMFGLHLGSAGKKSNNKGYKRKHGKLEQKRKVLFPIAILFNVGLLVWFKLGFAQAGLPLGISFYTFQMISYLTDVRCDEVDRENSFIKFATYVTMFPKLVSGPITDYGSVWYEMSYRRFGAETLRDGLKVFTMGLAAKVLLADRIALLWQEIQVTGFESVTTPMAWIGAIGYSLTIYFDFYGYSLMALGLGKMFGFHLPENFRNPYMAGSVREFYRRWHMSLGKWFTKYVYIPLGGSREGVFKTITNLLVVWLLTSLWHGGSLNFLLWGMGLCAFILLERLWAAICPKKVRSCLPCRFLSHIYLLTVITVSWMCFAIEDLGELRNYLGRMFDFVPAISVNSMDWQNALKDYGGLLLMGMFGCTPAMKKLFNRYKDGFVGTVLLVLLFWYCVWCVLRQGENPFMYFDF